MSSGPFSRDAAQLIELFYIGMPVVRTDGLSAYGHVITKFSGMGRLLHFLTHGNPLAHFARESFAINKRSALSNGCYRKASLW